MHLKHKVHVNVDTEKTKVPAVSSGETTVRKHRLRKFLMGEKVNVLVVSPEESVTSVEIHEVKEGGEEGGNN